MTIAYELAYTLYRIHDGGVERSLESATLHEAEGDLAAAHHALQQARHHRAEAVRYWALLEDGLTEFSRTGVSGR